MTPFWERGLQVVTGFPPGFGQKGLKKCPKKGSFWGPRGPKGPILGPFWTPFLRPSWRQVLSWCSFQTTV